MTAELARPVEGRTYRRPQNDKPLRLIWRDPETKRDRSKAFKWAGPLQDDARYLARIGGDPLLVDLKRGLVRKLYDSWREPTEEEARRVRARHLVYEPRLRA